ncbi:YhfC family glutamic-type intramembrane protease [Hyphomicrobium sp. LHD-15]|uniref:YhfC family glutamic-type intramembrane protease n=1 Tax=Hyphomicrobium sp. LHD-15 TaxID=3072142 RepID=UPI00280DCE40|nr:YhfC family glutamic-type intramembrane protease [Hyphomicrobium sp. LHD-15]MDQ8700446.1 YhfC family glutamic-type intramembrane protease [Hyphomicrobium sp. LHD-15]
MIAATIPLAAVSMIVFPIVLVWWLTRRLSMPLSLALCGAGTFLVAQALRFPLLQGLTSLFETGALPAPPAAYLLVFNIAVLSLTAGLFEEGARYGAYRYAIPEARSWNAAVTFGAGHGAMEAVILGGLMGVEFFGMLALGTPEATQGVDPATHAQLAEQTERYWALPAYMPLIGALERAFAIGFHIAMAVFVLQAVVRRSWTWLAAAIAAHALANAAGAVALVRSGPVAAEIVVAIFAGAALYIAFRLRRPANIRSDAA